MSDLYFEISLVLENFAKNYGVPHTNYYFRVNKHKPSKEEYRRKVVEYMRHYDHTSLSFAGTPNYEELKNFVSVNMEKMVEQVLQGKNNEVEKRYTYYMMNEP
ncbi:MAG: hypothetical protein HMLIMOIP_000189 [Candidatus Nitrosomirales archaeon]|jgi:hypothetical protein